MNATKRDAAELIPRLVGYWAQRDTTIEAMPSRTDHLWHHRLTTRQTANKSSSTPAHTWVEQIIDAEIAFDQRLILRIFDELLEVPSVRGHTCRKQIVRPEALLLALEMPAAPGKLRPIGIGVIVAADRARLPPHLH